MSMNHLRDSGPVGKRRARKSNTLQAASPEIVYRRCDRERVSGHSSPLPPGGGLALAVRPVYRRLGGVMSGGIPKAQHCVRLGTLLPFDYVEFDFIAFFERFVSVQLDC